MPDEDETFGFENFMTSRPHTLLQVLCIINKLNGHRSLNSAHKSGENSHEMPAMCKVITPDKDKGLISEIIII